MDAINSFQQALILATHDLLTPELKSKLQVKVKLQRNYSNNNHKNVCNINKDEFEDGKE